MVVASVQVNDILQSVNYLPPATDTLQTQSGQSAVTLLELTSSSSHFQLLTSISLPPAPPIQFLRLPDRPVPHFPLLTFRYLPPAPFTSSSPLPATPAPHLQLPTSSSSSSRWPVGGERAEKQMCKQSLDGAAGRQHTYQILCEIIF